MPAHQLKDGRWVVQYPNPKPPPRLIREYFGRGLEAEKKARQRAQELDTRPYVRRTPPKESPLFEDLAMAYLHAKRSDMDPVNLKNLEYKLRIILAELGPNLVYRITTHRMNQYVEKRLKTPKKRKKKDAPTTYIKRTTVNREICDIQAILNWAVQNEYITRNPIAGFKKPKRDDAIIQPPTMAETRALVKNAPAHLVRALVLSYYTGLRPGAVELFRIQWTAVDWDEETIFIESAKKKGRPFRIVPIHEAFLPRLRAWYEEDAAHRGSDGLIIHYRGRGITTIKTAFATAKKRRASPTASGPTTFATPLPPTPWVVAPTSNQPLRSWATPGPTRPARSINTPT